MEYHQPNIKAYAITETRKEAIDEHEAFIGASFASAKGGAIRLAPPSVIKA
jgi:hypothetical protein